MKNRVFASAFLVSILVLSMLAFALADENNTNITSPSNETETPKAISNSSMINETRCHDLNQRIDERFSQYDDNKVKRLNSLNNLINQVSNTIDKLEARGFDVAQLKTDFITMQDKINKTTADYAIFMQKLGDTKNFTCGHSQGQFVAALQQARDQLAIVKEDTLDVRSFYIGTIKADIMNIRQAAREAKQQQNQEMRANETKQKGPKENNSGTSQ